MCGRGRLHPLGGNGTDLQRLACLRASTTQGVHRAQPLGNGGGHELFAGRPAEDAADAVHLRVDVGARPVLLDHLGSARLECQGAELDGRGMAVTLFQDAEGVADVEGDAAPPAETVVIFRELPIGKRHLVDGDVGGVGVRSRKPPAVGLPLRDDAGILDAAPGGAVLSAPRPTSSPAHPSPSLCLPWMPK